MAKNFATNIDEEKKGRGSRSAKESIGQIPKEPAKVADIKVGRTAIEDIRKTQGEEKATQAREAVNKGAFTFLKEREKSDTAIEALTPQAPKSPVAASELLRTGSPLEKYNFMKGLTGRAQEILKQANEREDYQDRRLAEMRKDLPEGFVQSLPKDYDLKNLEGKRTGGLIGKINREYNDLQSFPLQGREWIKEKIATQKLDPSVKNLTLPALQQRYPEEYKQTFDDYLKTETSASYLRRLNEIDRFGVGDKDIKSLESFETTEAWGPNNVIPGLLNGLFLNVIDFNDLKQFTSDSYSANGRLYYKGIDVGDEFLTAQGKQQLEIATTTSNILGAFPTYGAGSALVKKGVSQLAASENAGIFANMAKAVNKAKATYPILTEITAFNFLEEMGEAGIRKASNQDYTFNDFLNGLKWGAVFGAGFEGIGAAIDVKATQKYLAEIEDYLAKNQDQLISKNLEKIPDIAYRPIGEVPAMELFKEARFAYLRGTKDGSDMSNFQPVGSVPIKTKGKKVPGKDVGATGKIVKQPVKVDNLNLNPKAAELAIQKLEALGFDSRQVKTFGDFQREAEKVGLNPAQLLYNVDARRLTGEEVLALRTELNFDMQRIDQVNKELKKVTSEGDRAKLEAQLDFLDQKIDVFLQKIKIAETEFGRNLVSLKIKANRTLDADFWLREAQKSKNYKKNKERPLTPEEKIEIQRYIAEKDRLGLADYVAALREPSLVDKVLSVRKALLLSNPTSHMANILGTGAHMELEKIKDIPATALDVLIYKSTGLIPKSIREKYKIEPKRTKALSTSIGKGWVKESMQDLKKTLLRQVEKDAFVKAEVYSEVRFKNPLVDQFLGGTVRGIFRGLESEDAFFYGMMFRKAIYENAKVRAINEGWRGKDLKKKVQEYYENPADIDVGDAINVAERATFRNYNALAAKLGAKVPDDDAIRVIVDLVAPFRRTPTNVAGAIINYSPLGILNTLVNQITPKNRGQKRFVEDLSRNLVGTGGMYLGMILAEQGLLTGNGPEFGSKEHIVWSLEGRIPNAVKIKDSWVSLERLAPVGNILNFGADMYFSWKNRDANASALDLAAIAVANQAQSFTEQSFLQGLSEGLKTLNDPDRSGKRLVQNLTASFVPSVIGAIARGLDPYERDTSSNWWSRFQSRLPVLREKLPKKVTVLGKEIENPNGVAASLLNPFRTSEDPGSPLVDEMKRLYDLGYDDAVWGNLSETFTQKNEEGESETVKMNGIQYAVYAKFVRNPLAARVERDIQSPLYQNLSDDQKANYLSRAASAHHKNKNTEFSRQVSEIRRIIQEAPEGDVNNITPEDLQRLQQLQTELYSNNAIWVK